MSNTKDAQGDAVPVMATPNSGQPKNVDTRTMYMSTPEYFGMFVCVCVSFVVPVAAAVAAAAVVVVFVVVVV